MNHGKNLNKTYFNITFKNAQMKLLADSFSIGLPRLSFIVG